MSTAAMMVRTIACAFGAVATIAALARGAERKTFTIDSDRSRAVVMVGKSGVLSFAAGHTHQVETRGGISGTIEADAADPARSRVHIEIDASRLMVADHGESADDVPKVQETMDSDKVLNVSVYPTITFDGSNISALPGDKQTENAVVAGRLMIRKISRPIQAPVAVHLDGGTLTATGRFSIKQTDFGIRPVSVGGVVAVKNELNISFNIVAR